MLWIKRSYGHIHVFTKTYFYVADTNLLHLSRRDPFNLERFRNTVANMSWDELYSLIDVNVSCKTFINKFIAIYIHWLLSLREGYQVQVL